MHCHDLPIHAPCHESWEAMAGDEGRRHCASCDHSVVALSALTRGEAITLLAALDGGHRCVRYEHDAAGEIRFADSKETGDKPAKPVRPMMGRIAPPKPQAPAPSPAKPPVKP